MRRSGLQRGTLALALLALLFAAFAHGAAPVSVTRAEGAARPVLAAANAAPALVAAHRSWRAEVAPDPRRLEASRSLLHDALAANLAASFPARRAIPHALPGFGLAVPSCHAQQRWWLAHATSTSLA